MTVSLRIIGILLLVLAVRAAWLAIFPVDPIGPVDAEGFHLLAVNVLDGRGFAIGWEPPFCPTAVRTPLYPLFLMGCYAPMDHERLAPMASPTAPALAVLAQLLLEVLTAALVVRLGYDLGGRRVGMLAGVLYALNGTTQRYTGYLLSEALLLPLLTAALLATTRYFRRPSASRAALAGLLWGLSLLTKPNAQFLALTIGILIVFYELRSIKYKARDIGRLASSFQLPASRFTPLVFWLTLLAVLFPWLLRNRIVFGRWMLSTAFEENLARVGVVATLAEVDGVRAEPWTATWEYDYARFIADVGARYGWCALTALREPCAELRQRQLQIARAAREVVLAHPLAYTRAHARGVLWSVLDPGHRTWYRALTGRDWEPIGVVASIWPRIAWSLERGAMGDALGALWSERVVRLPVAAALIWWGLVAARIAVWVMVARGVGQLRCKPWVRLTLVLAVAYLVVLPGPIAYDRFYLPAIPAVVVLVALGTKSVRFYPPMASRRVDRGCPGC